MRGIHIRRSTPYLGFFWRSSRTFPNAVYTAYILFSLMRGFSALSLARGFSPHPLAATLLFLVDSDIRHQRVRRIRFTVCSFLATRLRCSWRQWMAIR